MNTSIKTFATLVLCLLSTVSFAAVKFGSTPTVQPNGQDFVADIVAASYAVYDPNVTQPFYPEITIMLKADKLNESTLTGGALVFSAGDFAMGQTLAASIGGKVAVTYDNNYNISSVTIITDEYWNGSKKK